MFNFLKKRNTADAYPKINYDTFLLWEPCSTNHAEVVPGFTKYLLDLGYSVSVLVEPERIDEGLFSLFGENERVYLNRMSGRNVRKFLLKNGLAGAKGILITTLTDKIMIKDIPLAPKQKILCVSHDVRNDAALIDERTITLRRVDYGVKTIVVNPLYFGEVPQRVKNEIVNFISVGALRAKRRNTYMLIEAARKLYRDGTRDFVITVIGKGTLRGLPKELSRFFRIKGRLEFRDMYEEIKQADFFLPLLDPDTPEHDRYVTTGTSGSFQLIYGFLKPPIIASGFAAINGFDDYNSLIYENNIDMSVAMEKAIRMTAEDYSVMRENLKRYADDLYRESLENISRLVR